MLKVLCLHNIMLTEKQFDETAWSESILPTDVKIHSDKMSWSYSTLSTDTEIRVFNILLWIPKNQESYFSFPKSVENCFFTTTRNELKNCDAVLINGQNKFWKDFPPKIYPNQKYVYVNMESPHYYPICVDIINVFHWTMTYKLNSDIKNTYFQIVNMKDEIVGPKENMQWVQQEDLEDVHDVEIMWKTKTKCAVWFVSNCKTPGGREHFAQNLSEELYNYNLTIEVIGKCGSLKCPRSKSEHCLNMVKKEYFFYMALENSISEDYVTEKLLCALQRDAIPVVYGGANYSRFLPPGSYLDGMKNTPKQLASTMHEIIQSFDKYKQYFRWRSYYKFQIDSRVDAVRELCEMLNNETNFYKTTVYNNIRTWWNNPTETCKCQSIKQNSITLLFVILASCGIVLKTVVN